MIAARHILMTLLIVLTLPWGAVLRVAEARTLPLAPVVAVEAQLRGDQAQVLQGQAHKCRTAVFPGASCSFNALLPDDPRAMRPDSIARLEPLSERTGASRFEPSPDLGPPRTV